MKFQRWCRLCLRDEGASVHLFSRENDQEPYSKYISKHFQIQIDDKENWPSLACRMCIKQIDEMRTFIAKITSAQQQFSAIISSTVPAKFEEIVEYTEVTLDDGDSMDDPYTNEPSPSPPGQVTKEALPSWEDDKADLEDAMKTMNLLVCHLCNAQTTSYFELKNHFQALHQLPGYIFCCDQKFGPHTAHSHIQYHQRLSKHSCETCGKSFSSRDSLRAHQKVHQTQDLSCETCGRVFRNKYNLRLHRNTHIPLAERDLSHTCHVCGKGFDCNRNLNQHLKTHQRTKSEQCPICELHFFDIKSHVRRQHSQERRKEVCTICGHSSTRLKEHIRLCHQETTQKFPCEVCGKEFRTQRHYKKHALIHTGYRVPCRFCSHEATTTGNLCMHMKSQHPAEYEEYRAQKNREPKFRT